MSGKMKSNVYIFLFNQIDENVICIEVNILTITTEKYFLRCRSFAIWGRMMFLSIPLHWWSCNSGCNGCSARSSLSRHLPYCPHSFSYSEYLHPATSEEAIYRINVKISRLVKHLNIDCNISGYLPPPINHSEEKICRTDVKMPRLVQRLDVSCNISGEWCQWCQPFKVNWKAISALKAFSR